MAYVMVDMPQGANNRVVSLLTPSSKGPVRPYNWCELSDQECNTRQDSGSKLSTHFVDVGILINPFDKASMYEMAILPNVVSNTGRLDHLLKRRATQVFSHLVRTGVDFEPKESLTTIRRAAFRHLTSAHKLAEHTLSELSDKGLPLGLLLHWQPFLSDAPGFMTLTYHPHIGIAKTAGHFIVGLSKMTNESGPSEAMDALKSLDAIIQTGSVDDGEIAYSGKPQETLSNVDIYDYFFKS